MKRSAPDQTSLYFFNTGESEYAYEMLGAHPYADGCTFAVWAPNAKAVHLAGSFNGFNPTAIALNPLAESGVWEATVPGVKRGDIYKYVITGQDGATYWRSDPYAFRCEERPGTAAMVWGVPEYEWSDAAYFEKKEKQEYFREPMSIYEVHMGSFIKGKSYRELAHELVDYAANMGYTHLELMPLCEYPLDMSWGYQITNYYAATTRYGTPEDLMYFINRAHEKGLGVLLDWVPAHFPRDEHGLRCFDGTPLYEHPDPRRGEQTEWGTMLFDYGRPQVQSFLLSNAFFWLREFHFDGLRVDAVSCILYLDYGKHHGEWLPNKFGGHENLEAVSFFKKLSSHMEKSWPNGGRLLAAEESTAFPYVTTPAAEGGLGFHLKWNMGWMNDTLKYMGEAPIHRRWHHEALTFSLCYAFSEKYVLPFSHDEVVHGKKSMLDKMPGDYSEKFAQLRLVLAYQFAHPGKKLNFMGTEFGQFIEWRFDESLDWMLLDYPKHKEMQAYSRALNGFYKESPPLYERDDDWRGFTWAIVDDEKNSVYAFTRWDEKGDAILCAFNFKGEPWKEYGIPLPFHGTLKELFSTDDVRYGGTGQHHNKGATRASERPHVELPPFSAVFFRLQKVNEAGKSAVKPGFGETAGASGQKPAGKGTKTAAAKVTGGEKIAGKKAKIS